MSEETSKDGGSAFPHRYEDDEGYFIFGVDPGMTLRDYFAAQALISFKVNYSTIHNFAEGAAISAYKLADAMLEAREK